MGRRSLDVQMDVTDLPQIGTGRRRRCRGHGTTRHPRQQRGSRAGQSRRGRQRGRLRPDDGRQRQGPLLRQPGRRSRDDPPGLGRIVNLSSQAGFVALPTESIYCASKAAVAHLTKCLAVEWGQYGITVNAVAPTFIRTDGTAARPCRRAFEADVRERIAGLHRIGEPMDVAGGVVFLASPAASLITGTTLLIDGGWTAR